MNAVAETQVAVGRARDLKHFWLGKLCFIMIGRTDPESERRTGRDLDAMQHGMSGHAAAEALQGRQVAQDLFDSTVRESKRIKYPER